MDKLRTRKRLATVLAEVRMVGMDGPRVILEVPNGNAFIRDSLEDPQTKRLLAETVSQALGRAASLEYRFIAGASPGGAAEPRPRPSATSHPLVREALDVLGGTIVPDSDG
jgi:hypothetical protein